MIADFSAKVAERLAAGSGAVAIAGSVCRVRHRRVRLLVPRANILIAVYIGFTFAACTAVILASHSRIQAGFLLKLSGTRMRQAVLYTLCVIQARLCSALPPTPVGDTVCFCRML